VIQPTARNPGKEVPKVFAGIILEKPECLGNQSAAA
jgi:hypothetical protein